MKYRKVLLLNPYYPYTRFGAFRPPAGLGYVAEALKISGVTYAVLDMPLGYRLHSLIKRIAAFDPELIMAGMMTYMYKNTYSVFCAVKDRFPDKKLVVGGSHVSVLKEDALKECGAIDLGVVHEGEKTVVDLCKGVRIDEIKGVLYRDGSLVRYTGDRPFADDLDAIHFPTYSGFELKKYMFKEIDLITSRGCPYGCTFCTVRFVSGMPMRMRSASGVADEIEHWYGRGYRNLEFADDNFSFDKARVHLICDEISRRRLRGLRFRCGNGLRADKVDHELLKHMKEVGFKHIAFGVESASNRVLRAMRKGEDRATLEKAIKIACGLGFDVTLFFIIGLPEETRSTAKETFDFAARYPVLESKFSNPIPYPKTALFDWAASNKLFLVPPEKYLNDFTSFVSKPVYATEEFSALERTAALKLSDSVRKGVLKKSIRRKLKRYGVLARLFAYLYTIPAVERAFRENLIFRRLVDLITFAREGV